MVVWRILGLFQRVLRPARLALAGVQQLEDARDVFSVRADYIALRHRSYVEHFAAIQRLFTS